MASMTSPDEANIGMDSPAGDIEAVVGSFLNLPSVPALTQPTEAKAASAEPNTSAGDANSDECESSDDGDDSEDGDDAGDQMDLMLAMMRLLQKQMPKKKKAAGVSKSKSKAKASESAAPLLNGRGSSMDQEQLLTVLSKALSTMDSPDDEPASTPKQKRAKLSAANAKPAGPRQMPQLARPSADAAALAQQKANVGGCAAEGGEDTILHCFMDQLPQIDGHLDAMIAAADAAVDPQEAQPSPTEHVSSSAGASARGCSAQPNNARDDGAGSGSRFPPPNTPHFSAHERQTGSWDAVSSSSMDSSAAAAAAAAAAALAVNSRKRKSGEDEGAYAGHGGNGEQAAISSRSASEARWNGNGQMQECRPLSLPHAISNGPVVVSRQQMQQSACKPPLLSLPAACLAAPGSAPLLRAPVSNASAASAPPPPATPLRMLTVPADVSPTAAPMARPNVMDRFGGVGEDLSAEQPLGFPVRFGSKRMDDGYTDGAGNHTAGNGSHGYNDGGNGCDDGGMGYDDMGGDDMDDWMPRSRGRKDRQVAGGRIKARSMAERQRRERISEGLQKLRMAVRGHGDTATMLDNAVAYVQALQRRVTSLETNMLLHQASCGGLGQAGGALGGGNGSNSNNRGRHANGFINPSQFDIDAAVDSFLNLPAAAFPWTPSDNNAGALKPEAPVAANLGGKPAGKSGGKSGKAKAKKAAQRETQKQLLAAIMEALADSDDTDEPSSPESPAAPSPASAKRAKQAPGDVASSRRLPQLDSLSNSSPASSGNPSSALLDSFLGQLPQVDMHLDAIIAALDGPAADAAQPAAGQTGSSSAAVAQLRARNNEAERVLMRSSSTSSVDSSVAEAAAAAAAALAAGSRKRKASESEVVSPAAPVAPSAAVGSNEAEVSRQMRRALGAAILRSEPCPAAAAFPAPAPPPAALPVGSHANPVGRTLAQHGPLQMPIRLPAAPSAAPSPLAFPAPEAAACMNNDNSDDDMAGFGGSPACGGANGAADDADDWMPRSRGRKDRQVAGGRIKARSMAERQRRERISEGLQKLRMVVRGHGDTATMLDNAVAYVDALQRRVSSLETTLLLHKASCKHPGQTDCALASPGESSELL
ncbi:unnamed protein product [Closterium sp. Naga37s-1]|nr:unnamed protein product [Closterium sp. Naga37s-1]